MKRIIRLTESDLHKIITKVINEETKSQIEQEINNLPEDDPNPIKEFLKKFGKTISNFSLNPTTLSKLNKLIKKFKVPVSYDQPIKRPGAFF
jgi:hypothetical protein